MFWLIKHLHCSNYRENVVLILFIQYSKFLEIWAHKWRKAICQKNINTIEIQSWNTIYGGV